MGVWVAAIGSVVSGYFGSRDNKQNNKAQKAVSEQENRVRMWERQYDRRNALEDRQYKEQAVGAYKPYQRGTPLMAAPMTDPNSVEVMQDPLSKPRKKKG